MSDPFLGQVMAFGGNFAPKGWALCQGQLLPINQNAALYSLLGTTYGGNGTTNFALPDLRGRMIVGAGQGQGANYTPGLQGGAENATLTVQQLPPHSHSVNAQAVRGTAATPSGNVPAVTVPGAGNGTPLNSYASSGGASPVTMGPVVGSTGGGSPVPTLTPFTCINYIIALQGIYPQRP